MLKRASCWASWVTGSRRCASCTRALEHGRRRLLLVRSLPAVEASADLISDTMEHVREQDHLRKSRRKQLAWGAVGGLAACALVLLGVHLYYLFLQPGTVDLVVLGQDRLLASWLAGQGVGHGDPEGSG